MSQQPYASNVGVFPQSNAQTMSSFVLMSPNLTGGGIQQRLGPWIAGGFSKFSAALFI